MDIYKNKFLLVPFLVIAIAFTIDKILLSERIQTYFSKTMSEINYIQKEELYDDLKVYLSSKDRNKVLVYFGTSRALLFENKYIEEKYKGWTLFNFSVPGGTPDYALFWLERFEKENVKPDFVLMDQSVEAYNKAAVISLDDVLTNGLSIFFVFRHFDQYSTSQISTLLAKRMFKTYHYRPKLATILDRIKDDFAILYAFRNLRDGLKLSLREGRGSAQTPGSFGGVMPAEMLKKSARGDFHSYLVPFQYTEFPKYFLDGSYDILKRMQIPHAAIWVRLSRPYYGHIKNDVVNIVGDKKGTVYDKWMPVVIEFQKDKSVDFWNMNEDPNYNCDLFSDSGHMAPQCYRDYTDYIFENVIRSYNTKK
ncbi:DUF1574 domain-containing protein [Leptospira sp. GIMC2001]|uniref:DUF1574 domain-containing protein n=1 Tax=Leptospira sp. GIMC2001 TaxID=1513297 RepID=UPI00234BCC3E|nr:DUF1574 domain-containing protein [Leptospira sp. GIMC2001]WCL49001.1 DUF1574 domain-containing protein [Leptospira sp. GIMC2001]